MDIEANIQVDLNQSEMFDRGELNLRTFSRGTLINPINFITEEKSKEANFTPNNKSTQENDELDDDDDYNYDNYNPFSSVYKK